MIRIEDNPAENLLTVSVTDTVSKADYDQFKPVFEKKVAQFAQVNLCVEAHHLSLTPSAVWEELKMDAKHWNHYGHIAVVTDNSGPIKALVTSLDKVLPMEVRYFKTEELAAAKDWARSGQPRQAT